MRVLFRKGQLGTSGSVSWDFDHVGLIEAEPIAAGAAAAGRCPELSCRFESVVMNIMLPS
jgi:hypothetical protein